MALRLLEKGFSIIPLRVGEKEPLISWKEFQKRGGRNVNLASVVGSLLRSGASLEEAHAIASVINGRNQPPLPEKEVLTIFNSLKDRHKIIGGKDKSYASIMSYNNTCI